VVNFVVGDQIDVTLFELAEFSVVGSLGVFIDGVVFKDNDSEFEFFFIFFRFFNGFRLVSERIQKVNRRSSTFRGSFRGSFFSRFLIFRRLR